MINLIPNEEKKKKVKDFYFRLLVTSCFVFGVSMIITSAAIFPAYLFSSIKKDLTDTKLEKQKKEPVPLVDQRTLSTVKSLNNKLSLIEKNKANKYAVSQKIINEIILEKTNDIKIIQIFYQVDSLNVKTISINGTAPSRERLLLF